MFKFLPKPPIPGLYHVILIFIVIWTGVGLLLNWLNNAHRAQTSEVEQIGDRQQVVVMIEKASLNAQEGLPDAVLPLLAATDTDHH